MNNVKMLAVWVILTVLCWALVLGLFMLVVRAADLVL